MFFAKRRHALRLIDKLGIPERSELATELTDMLIAGAKQYQQMFRSVDLKFSDQDLILSSAAALTINQSAFERLSTDFGLGDVETNRLLDRIWQVGRQTAVDAGFSELVARQNDKSPRANTPE